MNEDPKPQLDPDEIPVDIVRSDDSPENAEPERELTSAEKRERMKEEFKKDLRERKAFLEKVKRLRQTKRITQALENMNYEDDSDDWIDKLNRETAFMEARNEIAMEGADRVGEDTIEDEMDLAVKRAKSEEEMKKIAAEELVRQMKAEIAAEAGITSVETVLGQEEATATETPETPTSVAPEAPETPDSESEHRPSRRMLDDIE